MNYEKSSKTVPDCKAEIIYIFKSLHLSKYTREIKPNEKLDKACL